MRRRRTEQPALDFPTSTEWSPTKRSDVMQSVLALRVMHARGDLGGQVMPEDVHPQLDRSSSALYHYFTLPMALNYQRDSYALWRAATSAFEDPEARGVFDPLLVAAMPQEQLRELLLRHRVALQHNKHPQIWRRICESLTDHFDGDVRNLFSQTGGRVTDILRAVQQDHKAGFPYLSGPKIANYWLYVISQYTDADLKEKELLSVAPDTHVMQASIRLGVVPPAVREHAAGRLVVRDAWRELLEGSGIAPIDIHTPLWLWSRSGFPKIRQ